MVKYTRVKYTALDDVTADLIWDFICLPPSELGHLETVIVYDVPRAMIENSRGGQKFTLMSDPYAKSSKVVCTTSRSPDKVYEVTGTIRSFTGIIVMKENVEVNKHKLYPRACYSGTSILTNRVQAHQFGWGHQLLFSRHKRYQCPYVDTLQESSDYYFRGYTNEIELTILGDVCDNVVLKIVTANLPRCFGNFKK
jgi:hypothetical protein